MNDESFRSERVIIAEKVIGIIEILQHLVTDLTYADTDSSGNINITEYAVPFICITNNVLHPPEGIHGITVTYSGTTSNLITVGYKSTYMWQSAGVYAVVNTVEIPEGLLY